MRVALYLRVSTKDQAVENQRTKLREFAKMMNWKIAKEYADEESGTSAKRQQFLAMMDAASKREFDCILVWSLDRFSREGIGKTCDHLRKLASYKVTFRSFSEPFLDTTSDFAELVTAIFAFFAAFERKRIVERVHAGLDRARAKGTKSGRAIGRPRLVVDKTKAHRLRRQGQTVRQVAAALDISTTSTQRLLACSN